MAKTINDYLASAKTISDYAERTLDGEDSSVDELVLNVPDDMIAGFSREELQRRGYVAEIRKELKYTEEGLRGANLLEKFSESVYFLIVRKSKNQDA